MKNFAQNSGFKWYKPLALLLSPVSDQEFVETLAEKNFLSEVSYSPRQQRSNSHDFLFIYF